MKLYKIINDFFLDQNNSITNFKLTIFPLTTDLISMYAVKALNHHRPSNFLKGRTHEIRDWKSRCWQRPRTQTPNGKNVGYWCPPASSWWPACPAISRYNVQERRSPYLVNPLKVTLLRSNWALNWVYLDTFTAIQRRRVEHLLLPF